ncbi:MAG: SRPBCC domain-containing protein [Solirubrobacterales bacterium]|nr:SRPBCC domain-containing protein [Solirubrobacterales bacterium]
MTDAKLVGDGAKPAVRLERELQDPPATVWLALTDPARLRDWFPCGVEVEGGEWRVGAALRFPFPPEVIEMTLTGKVLVVDEPHELSYTWGDETLSFQLVPLAGGGTRLVLTDELSAGIAARNAAGWEHCLDRLSGKESASWQQLFGGYSRMFEPELGPQEGPPAEYKGDVDAVA